MAFVIADRVKESTTTTGTGAVTLGGAATGYQSFSVIGNANTTYYTIAGQGTSEWEVGIGTYTAAGTSLSRDTVLASSNAGGLVVFSAGTKDVFVTYPAEVAVMSNVAQTLSNKTFSDNPTFSAGTANGVPYLNASKVLTSGSALTFDGTNFYTTGSVVLNNAQYYYGKTTGAVTTRMLGINGANDLYFGSVDASVGNIIFTNNGEQMRLTSTGLGIGTSSITSKLTLAGGIDLTASTATVPTYGMRQRSGVGLEIMSGYQMSFGTNGTADRMFLDQAGNLGLGVTPSAWNTYKALQIGNGSGQDGMFAASTNDTEVLTNAYYNTGWKYQTTGGNATRYAQSGGYHYWFTAPSGTAGAAITFTQAMTLDASGRLLVGTGTSPSSSSVRQVLSGTTVGQDAYMQFAYGGGGGGTVSSATGAGLTFGSYTGAVGSETYTERARIDSSGNFGINTTSPGSKLDVNGDVSVRSGFSMYADNIRVWGSGNLAFSTNNPGSQAITFSTGNAAGTERARIDSSGNLLVGTTSTTITNGGIYVAPGGSGVSAIGIGHATGSASGNQYTAFQYAGSVIGTITQNGTTAVAYNTTSDHRLKNNVRTADAKSFDKIRFVDFEWVDGRHDCGVIAHELQAIYPDLVVGDKDAVDEEGKDQYQQVNYIGLIPRMGTVIQQLMAKVEALEARIQALEAK